MAAARKPIADPEALRAKLMNDANTKGIAEKIGVSLEEYVEQVIHFATNPDAEPQLYVVEDQDLRGLGMEPPDEEAMGKYVMEAATVAAATERTDFTAAKKEMVSISDLRPVGGAPDDKLKDELSKELRGKRGGKS